MRKECVTKRLGEWSFCCCVFTAHKRSFFFYFLHDNKSTVDTIPTFQLLLIIGHTAATLTPELLTCFFFSHFLSNLVLVFCFNA